MPLVNGLNTLAAFLLCFAHGIGVAADVVADHLNVAGLTLGLPLRLLECPYKTFALPGYPVEKIYQPGHTCLKEAKIIGPNWFTLGITFEAGKYPSLMRGGILEGLQRDGILVGVSFSTHGIDTQEIDLKALTEKYGAPTKSSITQVQNRMGAKYDSVTAIWALSNITVTFSGTFGTLTEGRVTIDLPEAADLRRANTERIEKILNPRKL
jgi:hypothetical protein